MKDTSAVKGELVVINGWVAEDVGHHTCGTGEGGHYGTHEPYCGLVPVAPLALLEPLRAWVKKSRESGVWVWGVRDPIGWTDIGPMARINWAPPLEQGTAGSLVEAHDAAAAAVLRLMVERSGS